MLCQVFNIMLSCLSSLVRLFSFCTRAHIVMKTPQRWCTSRSLHLRVIMPKQVYLCNLDLVTFDLDPMNLTFDLIFWYLDPVTLTFDLDFWY